MSLPSLSPKELQKLAAACRKAGITSFKGYGIEFTLGAEPLPRVAKSAPKQTALPGIQVQGPNGPIIIPAPTLPSSDEIETDSPTAQELLFWSVGDEVETTT